jgi:hypothetical protein
LAYSPDGRQIVSGLADTLLLWDAAIGGELDHPRVGSTFSGYPNDEAFSHLCKSLTASSIPFGTSVHFLPDGRHLVHIELQDWGMGVSVWIWDLEMAEFLDTIPAIIDVAVPTKAEAFRWRTAMHGFETVIEAESTGEGVAWWPIRLDHIARHSSARIWAGVAGSYLCLFTLEGDL